MGAQPWINLLSSVAVFATRAESHICVETLWPMELKNIYYLVLYRKCLLTPELKN